MILALLFPAACFLAGLAVLPREKNNVVWAVLAGSGIGVSVLGMLAWFLGLNDASIALACVGLLGFFAWQYQRGPMRLHMDKEVAVAFTLAFIFFFLAATALFRIEDAPRGVRIDFGFHQSIVTSMASGNYPASHPLLAGEPLRYYDLPHLFSASLMVGGLDVTWATWIPFAAWNAALLAGILLLARRLSGSWKIAALATLLFLFNGTFAFVPYLQTHDVLGNMGAFLQDPGFLSDYRDTGFPFENNLVAQAFFTRSFPLGFGLLVLLLVGLLEGWDLRRMGFLAGVLPMIHLPSFGLWVLFAATYAVMFDRRREWLVHFGILAVLSAPALAFLLGGSATSGIRWHFGWMAPDASPLGWVLFWLGNIGLFAILCAYGLGRDTSPLAKFLLAALPAFVIGNVVLLAPYAWDNIKLFLLFFLLLAVGSAMGLARLWKSSLQSKGLALALLAVMTFSGVLHASSILAHQKDALYPSNDWAACQWMAAQSIAMDGTWLTDGTHTCVSGLLGRRVVVGPLEWLEHHGLDFAQQLSDNDAMLQGDCRLLMQYGVAYFYDGGYLGRGSAVNRTFWDAQPKVYEKQGVTIHQAACGPVKAQ